MLAALGLDSLLGSASLRASDHHTGGMANGHHRSSQGCTHPAAGRHRSAHTSEAWTGYLKVASRSYRYSPNNCVLIWTQRPEASQVAGYRRWQELGRHVRKGEKGIAILAPCKYKSENDQGEDERVIKGFRTAYVFDISQTEGEELAALPISRLSGDGPAVMHALTEVCPWPWVLRYLRHLSRADQERADRFRQLSHHDPRGSRASANSQDNGSRANAHPANHIGCRSVAELEAESTAFVVCDSLGIDSSAYSFAYAASWSTDNDNGIERIKAHADRIQKTASTILATLGVEPRTP